MSGCRVAITGASGFIGRHVLAELASRSVAITAVALDAAELSNAPANVKIVEMDITKPGLDIYERLQTPDVLIHLAWGGLPNYKSLHHFEAELPAQYAFLKGLVEAGLPALLAAGTCFEYGMQSGALSEDLPPLPNTPYSYAKNALRQQLEFLRHVDPFAFTWTRIFYMYGEGQSKNSLYPQLKEAVLRGDRSFNMSGGEQVRDYLPVAEVARLIVELAMRRCDAGVVNVCSGKPVSVRKLVEQWLVENKWHIELNLGHYPYADYEPMSFWGNPGKLNATLGIRDVK
jgi:dTDP-6-deoxy-L-talose 4-dehydrogenase (NAD+)